MRCLQTPTGLKFYVVAHPDAKGLDSTLNDIYQLFCDYVLKNPFYEIDQPVRAAKFEVNLIEANLNTSKNAPNIPNNKKKGELSKRK